MMATNNDGSKFYFVDNRTLVARNYLFRVLYDSATNKFSNFAEIEHRWYGKMGNLGEDYWWN